MNHSHHVKPTRHGWLAPLAALIGVLALVCFALNNCHGATEYRTSPATCCNSNCTNCNCNNCSAPCHAPNCDCPCHIAAASDYYLLPYRQRHQNDSQPNDCRPAPYVDPAPQPILRTPEPEQRGFPTGAIVLLCGVGGAIGLKSGFDAKFHPRHRGHK